MALAMLKDGCVRIYVFCSVYDPLFRERQVTYC